jgi:hypothetical protein
MLENAGSCSCAESSLGNLGEAALPAAATAVPAGSRARVSIIRIVATSAAATTTGLFLFNLVGLVVLGSACSSKSYCCNAEASLEARVMVGRFVSVSPAIFIGAVCPCESLGAESSKSRAGNDFASTMFWQIAPVVSAALKHSSHTSTSKGTFSKVQPVVIFGTLTALAAHRATVMDIIVFVIIAVVVITTTPAIAGHGPVPVAATAIVSAVRR